MAELNEVDEEGWSVHMADRTWIGKQRQSSLPLSPRGIKITKPRQMKGSPFDQSDCWFCGAHDSKACTDEYGWYEEMVSETGGVSITFKNQLNTYMPIGQRTVSICSRCIAAHNAVENSRSAKVLLWMTVFGLLGTFFSGIFYGFLDWMGDVPVLYELYFPLADVWRHDHGNHILTDVFAFALAFISAVMLIPAAVLIPCTLFGLGARLFRGKAARHNRDAIQANGMTHEDREALRNWARYLGAAQLMLDNAKVDPFFLFHPDADDDGQRHFVLADRKEWIREYKGMTFRHWIEHRRPDVEKWETKPMPRRMDEETRTPLTRKGLKPPGGWL